MVFRPENRFDTPAEAAAAGLEIAIRRIDRETTH